MECRRAKTEVRSQSQRTQEIQRTNQMKQFIISGRVVLEKCVNNYLPCFHSGLDDKVVRVILANSLA